MVAAELELLREHGHEVITYYQTNDSIQGLWRLGVSGLKTLWNWRTYSEFRALLRKEKPDVVHSHNTFPLISPAIHWACAKEGVPVVQTLHNFRLLCIGAFFYREGAESGGDCSQGAVCELCLDRAFKWPGIRYSCYRGSKAASVVATSALFLHRMLGTWTEKVTAYIALTEFQRLKMVEGGFPAEKISVKPNFLTGDLAERGAGAGEGSEESTKSYALFVGRLSPEKGCDVLISAWKQYRERVAERGLEGEHDTELLIVGDGPERQAIQDEAGSPGTHRITLLGRTPREKVLQLMSNARFMVLPSIWYEGFPMTIVESFCCGTPVVATDDGGMSEIIIEKENGLKFRMGDSAQLAESIEWAVGHPVEMDEMGVAARKDFEERYGEEKNYEVLMDVYRRAVSASGSSRSCS